MDTEQATVTFGNIPGFPGYRVGDDGTVWRAWVTCRSGRKLTDKWRPMKLSPGPKGYFRVNLVPPEGGSYRTFRVHRLVLEVFVGPCPEGMECRHLNGIKADCRLSNLAWGTQEENREDNRKHGRYSDSGRNLRFTYDGQTHCLKDWSTVLGIPYACLYQRIRTLGMTFEEAISRPYEGTASNGAHWLKLKLEREASREE